MANRVQGAFAVSVLALCVSGCVENLPDFKAMSGDVRATVAAQTGGSPRAATVAMTSLDGVPDGVAARFDRTFAKEAAAREITIVGPSTAHYLVRAYMSAYPADGSGTAVSFVYDVFDANDQRRVDRVSDVLTLPGSSDDPWSLVDDRVVASLAGRSADVLAAALATTDVARASPSTLALASPAAPN